MRSDELRRAFLAYFEANAHTVLPSSALLPQADPTLLFTNAGMNQFKDYFLGTRPAPFPSAATCQKCARAGGKHNDLENVGYTRRHLTFFEMLGNFSFGDYFKKKAISYAWSFLVGELGMPRERLWVTVYHEDAEAARLWAEIAELPEERVVGLGVKDNFWAMGDTGPCGPCSEIYYDFGPALGCGRPDCKPGCDCDRFFEIWNNVFMQFERSASGEMTPLPRPSIDTGMGLERLSMVMQGVFSVFDTDLFRPLIEATAGLCGRTYGADANADVAMRVIADHARAGAFLIADGILPGNVGREYVLRRIMRRAFRYGKVLGFEEPFLFKVAGVVVDTMGGHYGELKNSAKTIAAAIQSEEERFLKTLDRGLVVFQEALSRCRQARLAEFPGDVAFTLKDTYGLPLDLLRELADEEGMVIGEGAFEQALTAQRQRSKKAGGHAGGEEAAGGDVYRDIRERLGMPTSFVGYEELDVQSRIAAIVKDGRDAESAGAGEQCELLLAATPFYAESGGQVGDVGTIALVAEEVGRGGLIEVDDTRRPVEGIVVHRGRVANGTVRVTDIVRAAVNRRLRLDTTRHHSATHILQWALREVLGPHVKQAGSLVEPNRLRFDFSHFAPMAPEEIAAVEDLVNEKVLEDCQVTHRTMGYRAALQLGALAFFGEKYGESVRVVDIGSFSVELCGGTHVRETGEIGLLRLVSETGVQAGVRRLEAVVGRRALETFRHRDRLLAGLTSALAAPREELVERAEKLLAELRAKDRQIETLQAALGKQQLTDAALSATDVHGVKVLARHVAHVDQAGLRDLADQLKQKLGSGLIVLGTAIDGSVFFVAAVTADLTDRLHAGDIVKEVAKIAGGGGGGRRDMALAGGKKPEKLSEALAAVTAVAERALAATGGSR
ncbi:MAG: alanine--tRNA ligase [Candidatus Schekmanbacteria bacterium]|nr:alanine--tRNA ligase [Candidatus Schekmanbacteria bacterium]